MLHKISNLFSDTTRDTLSSLSPIVVMGRGHSGTRILTRIISSLGVNLGSDEDYETGDTTNRKFTKTIKQIASNNLDTVTVEQIHDIDMKRFNRAISRYYQSLDLSASLGWGWKFPETYLIGPYVAKTFPRAKYIHLVRDGRDVAFKKHQTDNIEKPLGRRILQKLSCTHEPRYLQAARSWAFQLEQFDSFRKSLAPESILDVSFEEICKDPVPHGEKIAAFLELPMTEECMKFLSTSIDKKKIAQFRKEDATHVSAIEKAIGPSLAKFGYSLVSTSDT